MQRAAQSLWIVLILVHAATAAFAQSPHEHVTWYAIAAGDGAPLGHASLQTVSGGNGREIIRSQEIYVREQGGQPMRTITRTVTRENRGGRTVSITKTSRSAHFSTRTEAEIGADGARLLRETPAGRWTDMVVLPPGVRFDGGEGLLRGWDPVVSPRLEFDNFDIDAAAVERIVIEAAGPPDAGGRVTAFRTRYEGGELRGVARMIIGPEGRIVELAQPMFGATIHIRETDSENARRAHPPYQIVPNMMTRSPQRISAEASRGHIRYRFAFRDDIRFAPPQTGEQRASADAEGFTLDVCAACGPGLRSDPETLAAALRPTAWLQSDNQRLRAIAAPVAALNVSDARKMEILLERARPYIARIDYTGHYSALDTIVRRAGDCTEAAVLLAALGRAAGIPTRVASGLTYSRQSYHGVSNAFLPHSWTLAFVDGEWRSFDLALDEFNSTHLALTIGDGAPRSIAAAGQLASLLRFDSMAEVRRRVAR